MRFESNALSFSFIIRASCGSFITRSFTRPRCKQDAAIFSITIMAGRDGLRRTEAFRGSRACFYRFDCAIAGRCVGYKRIEQMVCRVCNIIDGTIESCLVCLGRFRETAQLADELKRRSANLVVRRRWTEVMKCFDGSAHVRTINNSRLTINYFVFR
jgi:hypothetical protein